MISYYFPPIRDVGGLRALGFAKNMTAFGWEPYVLSVKNPDTSLCKVGSEGPPSNIKTYYCRSWFHLNRFTWKANGVLRLFLKSFGINLKSNIVQELACIPDAFVGWLLPAFLKGLDIIKKHNIDLIYVSSKPFSSALSGVLLKQVTNKPLVLDFRDPVSFPDILFLENWAGKMNSIIIRKMEHYALTNTDRLITTTRQTQGMYETLYPFLIGKTATIYNGYFLPPDTKPAKQSFEIFTIVYLGNFYYNLIPCETFFQALRRIEDQQLIPKGKFRFLYVGAVREKANWLEKVQEKFGLGQIVQATGHVPKAEAQLILQKSALMLLRIVPPMISTKLFEAFRDGVPILAVIDSQEVKELIQKYSKKSYVVSINSVEDTVSSILDAYNKWLDGKLKHEASKAT